MSVRALCGAVLLSGCFLVRALAGQPDDADLQWDTQHGQVSYTVTRPCLIKVRAGIKGVCVMRTIVNGEERGPGRHIKPWDGRDDAGIDLARYSPLYLGIQTIRSPEEKDIPLILSRSGHMVTVDIAPGEKPLFLRQGAELRAYLSGKIVYASRVSTLPVTFAIPRQVPGSEQLLTVNLKQRPGLQKYAVGNLVISGAQQQSVSAPQREGMIAYACLTGEHWQIWTAKIDGSNERQVTEGPEDKRFPSFSNDGRFLAWTTISGKLWITDLSGGESRHVSLPVLCAEPEWSPDDRKILFTSYDDPYHSISTIWTVDLVSVDVRKVVNRPGMQYQPAWSPDGEKVIFVDGPELIGQELRTVELGTGQVQQASDSGSSGYEAYPAYLADGAIIYSGETDGSYDIFLREPEQARPVALCATPQAEFCPSPSRDGKTIYFLSDESGVFEVMALNRDGSARRSVTRDGRDKHDLAVWAP